MELATRAAERELAPYDRPSARAHPSPDQGDASLKAVLGEKDWCQDMWLDAIAQAFKETGIDEGAFPGASPWDLTEALSADFWPDA